MGQLFHRPHINKKQKRTAVEDFTYVVAFIGPIMTIPQVTKIWLDGKVDGVSPLTWGTYTLLAVFWILYGVAHKEKPIILTNILYFLVNTSIVLGVLLLQK